MIEIGRTIGGISLNGLEWLLNEDGTETLKFSSYRDVMDFLRANGYNDFSDEDLLDGFYFQEIED